MYFNVSSGQLDHRLPGLSVTVNMLKWLVEAQKSSLIEDVLLKAFLKSVNDSDNSAK